MATAWSGKAKRSMPSAIERNWISSATALAAAPIRREGRMEMAMGTIPPKRR